LVIEVGFAYEVSFYTRLRLIVERWADDYKQQVDQK
jgi:hypothetical protein